MSIAAVTIFTVLVILVGGIALQFFLSLRDEKWLGLILPAISICYTLLNILGVVVYTGNYGMAILGVFISTSIPTLVLLAVYFGCRSRIKRRKADEVERMKIKDL